MIQPKPLNNLVLIDRAKNPTTSEGGIVFPSSDEPQQSFGTVLAIGDKVTAPVQVDDVVLFSRYSGTEASFQGKDYLLLREEEMMATV
ncbi:co-chaperone GroES [Sansalvadorimonas verongulae]|uniref:co-chaperone GroES n=1 Tax=Sansalvadorimonas verongulae TaxID=2172824 RepID=UPI0012BD20E3|nr:co-chaperone GroES [Sansalvadorimonas verongulae]MTI15217.1 co-chaperone GroES [Sansalvadorimonas verongulae]